MDNQLIDIDRIPNLTPAQRRDFGMVKPYMENGNWVTSITLAKAMYQISDLSRKEIAKCSSILSKLFHNTDLLQRREKRKIFFQHITGKHAVTFAYRIDPDLLLAATKQKIADDIKSDIDNWLSTRTAS